MIKGIIFDLDGVLCSTDDYHYEAWKVIADKLNIHFDHKKNNRLRGVSRMESLDIILEDCTSILSTEAKQALAEEKNSIYRKLLTQMTTQDCAVGTHEVLHELKRKGIKLAIGSSSKNAKFILEKLEIMNCFDAVVDGTDIKNSKPDPEVFLKASSLLSLNPSECLVVEDSVAGLEAAIKGGFSCAAIGDATKHIQADFFITHIKDILMLPTINKCSIL